MSDNIRCFMVINHESGDVLLEYKTETTDRRNYGNEASQKLSQMKADETNFVPEQTRMGMLFVEIGEIDEEHEKLAYLIFVAPDYSESAAKQLLNKHARAVESMAKDGTFDPAQGVTQTDGAKKAYRAVCKTLASEYESIDEVARLVREKPQEKHEIIEDTKEKRDFLKQVIDFFDEYDRKNPLK